jgi:uncharacterized protein (TIGR02246 family)
VTDDETRALVERFGEAWNAHDLDAALALVTDDAVFESTGPAPDGERFVGKEAVRAAWVPIFTDPTSHFATEDLSVAGDVAVSRWSYSWSGGHVRGVDLIRVRDGLVAEKLSYVKG